MFPSRCLDPLRRARAAITPPPLRGRAEHGGTHACSPTTARGEIGVQTSPPVLWETLGFAASVWPSDDWLSSIALGPSWWCKHPTQRVPALGPCGSRDSGFGQGPEPRGMSHCGHCCMVPLSLPALRERRTGRGARPRVSLIQNLRAVCMACLLLRAVARLLSPALPPRRYKFHATCSTRWTARLRSPCDAQWPRGSRPSGGLAVCRASPQPRLGYRGDNITMIPG